MDQGHSHEVITISKAADLCNVNRATIWRWIKIGELKAAKTAGGHYRIFKKDLIQFIKDKEMAPKFRDSEQRKRILVIDDDPDIIKLFRRILDETDFEVDYAVDGFVAGIKTEGFKPHLIVLDLILPNMDGFEVCRQLRKNLDFQGVKIIAITGYDTKESEKKIIGDGADLFLPKPLDSRIVLREIHRLVEW